MQSLLYFDITENDERAKDRLLISFPPREAILKDFKKKFRGEFKWVAEAKAWSLPPQSKNRLEQWASVTQELAPFAREESNIEITKIDIAATEKAVKEEKAKYEALFKQTESLTLLKNILEDTKQVLREHVAEISALEASKAFTKQQIEVSKSEISATCLRLDVDLPALYKAYEAMKPLEASSSRADVDEWRKYHRSFIEARNAFSDAGLDFHAATFGAESKEKIANMPELAWFTITKL
ncbi:hypothetical protein ACXZ1M_24395 [Duganella sp. PWIR1]